MRIVEKSGLSPEVSCLNSCSDANQSIPTGFFMQFSSVAKAAG